MGTLDKWFGKPTKPLGQRLIVAAVVLVAITALLLECSLRNG